MKPNVPACPSAQHHLPGAQVFAVMGGTVAQPEVSYLEEAIEVTPEVITMAAPVDPAEVFRISAPCAQSTECWHFDDTRHQCRLARRTVRLAPVVVSKPPRCAIRTQCVWLVTRRGERLPALPPGRDQRCGPQRARDRDRRPAEPGGRRVNLGSAA
jgi:hypothetical protein